jgi:hypothetical protein
MEWKDWTSRGAALCVAVLLHLVVIAGFLATWRLGLPVPQSSNAHLADVPLPVIATIISFDAGASKASASTIKPLDADSLAAPAAQFDVSVSPPAWPSEDEAAPPAAQWAPTAGRTGLHCEVHIHQSPRGRIQAIDFGECTGDAVWQHTLLRTIERAAQLVAPAPDARFPPVRTLTVNTDNLSPILLAQQLSSVELFEDKTTPGAE